MILIDTTPLVALCDPRDSLNKTALAHLKVLAKAQFGVCEPVLAEACFHLTAPSQRIRLQRMLERLDVLPVPADDPQSLWKEGDRLPFNERSFDTVLSIQVPRAHAGPAKARR